MDEFEFLVQKAKKRQKKLLKQKGHEEAEDYKDIITSLEKTARKQVRAQNEKVRQRTIKLTENYYDVLEEHLEGEPCAVILRKAELCKTIDCLEDIMADLTDEEKEIFLLYYMDNHRQRQIARELDKSQTWVCTRLKEIKEKVSHRVEEMDG